MSAYRWVWWLAALVALPLAGLILWSYLQTPSRFENLTPVSGVQVWHEEIGQVEFAQRNIEEIVKKAPDWTSAHWRPVQFPDFQALGAAIDLPVDAAKRRAWYRIPIPESKINDHGRQGLLGLRVMGGAPWSLWVDKQLVQANLVDWRIQLMVPLRIAVPMGAREVILAVPYAEPQGFAVGSIYVGPMDSVDAAWLERNIWHLDLPRFMSAIALLLTLVSFHLAWARPQEPLFKLMGFNALAWSVCCFQWFFDPTGQDTLSIWYGSAVDSSITWVVVLACLFAFELENIKVPRLRLILLAYASFSTALTLPIWQWQKNALLAQHYFNVVAFFVGLGVLGWHIHKTPRREGILLFLALALQLGLGVHTLQNLTNQSNPDAIFSFPISIVALYIVFMYAMSRRTVLALDSAEKHEGQLLERLTEQEERLVEQYKRLQQLEVARRLDTQRDNIMQDLHDRLGSNLTSALLQARKGVLSPDETVLLLQDLADELRHVGEAASQAQRSVTELLAELRQRVQNRLAHGGIHLVWNVDPALDLQLNAQSAQHLLAMLSESIANIIKHAEADQIRIEAKRLGRETVITITDNGKGFDAESVELGRGLPGMRHRAEALGGSLHLGAAEPRGTAWRFALPETSAKG